MTAPVPLWVEPCAGSLAVGLRLLGLPRLTGWMGGKGGYADAILHALHLSPRQGAREVWLADVSDWSTCWEGLALPGVAHEAARRIDDWRRTYGVGSPREVRALWDVLLAEWKAGGTTPDAHGVARWLVLVQLSAMCRGPAAGPKLRSDLEWYGHVGPAYPGLIGRLGRWPRHGAPFRVWRDARAIPPAPSVCLIDPPYDATQGYEAGDLPRAEVLALADRWTAEGATVAICEHDPMPGWRSVDLTGARFGGGRVMSSRGTEWLSVRGVEPRRPVEQLGMFGGAA